MHSHMNRWNFNVLWSQFKWRRILKVLKALCHTVFKLIVAWTCFLKKLRPLWTVKTLCCQLTNWNASLKTKTLIRHHLQQLQMTLTLTKTTFIFMRIKFRPHEVLMQKMISKRLNCLARIFFGRWDWRLHCSDDA